MPKASPKREFACISTPHTLPTAPAASLDPVDAAAADANSVLCKSRRLVDAAVTTTTTTTTMTMTRDVVVPDAVQRDVAAIVDQIARSAGVIAAAERDCVRVSGACATAVDDACRQIVSAMAGALVARSSNLARRLAADAAPPTRCDEPCRSGGSGGSVRECVVCLSAPASVCCVPCGHVALCERDSVALLSANDKRECPVCRSKIESLLRVFF